MSKKDKPLPEPETTPFGKRKRFSESEGETPLLADQMIKAAAEGRLEEFLKEEFPGNEYARKLAMLMLELTGVLPPESLPPEQEKNHDKKEKGTK